MPHPATAQRVPSSLANRYGSSQSKFSSWSRGRKVLLWAAIALVVLSFVSWLTFGRGPGADNKLIGFTVLSPSQTTVDFQVTKDPASTAQCEVQALDDSYAVVGWKVVTIGPNGQEQGTEHGSTTKQRIALLTDSLAVSAVVDSCWIVKNS
ncbi:DUF4307 domain-containing protein [Psychromicrobium sp. YIM B11713]|uniref:DUF4307 domain-containing protein n=1 Tax=Psychromicrobium sp. YIM B11713 TaxID=3145233 RepID=UPI00374E4F5C